MPPYFEACTLCKVTQTCLDTQNNDAHELPRRRVDSNKSFINQVYCMYLSSDEGSIELIGRPAGNVERKLNHRRTLSLTGAPETTRNITTCRSLLLPAPSVGVIALGLVTLRQGKYAKKNGVSLPVAKKYFDRHRKQATARTQRLTKNKRGSCRLPNSKGSKTTR